MTHMAFRKTCIYWNIWVGIYDIAIHVFIDGGERYSLRSSTFSRKLSHEEEGATLVSANFSESLHAPLSSTTPYRKRAAMEHHRNTNPDYVLWLLVPFAVLLPLRQLPLRALGLLPCVGPVAPPYVPFYLQAVSSWAQVLTHRQGASTVGSQAWTMRAPKSSLRSWRPSSGDRTTVFRIRCLGSWPVSLSPTFTPSLSHMVCSPKPVLRAHLA